MYEKLIKGIVPSSDRAFLRRVGRALLDLPDKPEAEVKKVGKALKAWSDAFGAVSREERKPELEAWSESLASILKC